MLNSQCDILIRGRNRSLLFDKFSKNKIELINVKNIDEKNIIVTVNKKDCQKVFAILGKTWYNKLIRSNGLSSILDFLKKRLFILIASIFFLFTAFLSDQLIFGIKINGLTCLSSNEVSASIATLGAKKFAKFSDLNYVEIEDLVLSLSKEISFVMVKKSGNRLIIDIIESEKPQAIIDISKKNIISPQSGIIKKLNVFHGYQKKSVGDWVEAGEVIVSGEYTVDEKTFETYALCYAVIETSFYYEHFAKADSHVDEEIAKGLAKFYCPSANDENIENIAVEKRPNDAGVIYRVEVRYIIEVE